MGSKPIESKVVVSCATLETIKITNPIQYYGADKVYLFRNINTNSISITFATKIKEFLESKNIEVIMCPDYIFDYNTMFRSIYKILRKEGQNSKIYINISAGTPEYASAAISASMLTPESMPFTVESNNLSFTIEEIKYAFLDKDIQPIGLSRAVENPIEISTIKIESPEAEYIAFLRILNELSESKIKASSTIMIKYLKEEKIWSYCKHTARNKTIDHQKEVMFYRRHYIEPLIKKKWIEKKPNPSQYCLTPEGIIVLDLYRNCNF